MQLQPFKRPDYSTIQRTRDQIAALRPAIADAYTSGDSMSQTVTSGGPATGPQVGDLHPWDALVDGCLYIDPMCNDTRPFLMQFNDAWIWLPYEPVDAAIAEWQYLLSEDAIHGPNCHEGDRALVVATSIDTPEKCRDAIAAHCASQTGGAK